MKMRSAQGKAAYWLNSVSKKYIFEVYTFIMKNLSLKLDERVFVKTEKIIKYFLSRYIIKFKYI